MLSHGVPMLMAGDELVRTQRGNNNAYCQDNEISWIDWELDEQARTLHAFTRRLIALRRDHPIFRRPTFLTGIEQQDSGAPDIWWFRPDGRAMTRKDWERGDASAIGAFLNGAEIMAETREGEPIVDDSFLVIFNAWQDPLTFRLPPVRFGRRWALELSTADPGARAGRLGGAGARRGRGGGPLAAAAPPRRLSDRTADARTPRACWPAEPSSGASEHAEADLDDRGIELRPGALEQAAARLLDRERLAVRPRRRHRVERIADEDDPGLERNLVAQQAVRVALAVEALVAGADDRTHVLELLDRREDPLAELGVGLDQRPSPRRSAAPAWSGSRAGSRSCRCRGTARRARRASGSPRRGRAPCRR